MVKNNVQKKNCYNILDYIVNYSNYNKTNLVYMV